jgi:hypothetical protein
VNPEKNRPPPCTGRAEIPPTHSGGEVPLPTMPNRFMGLGQHLGPLAPASSSSNYYLSVLKVSPFRAGRRPAWRIFGVSIIKGFFQGIPWRPWGYGLWNPLRGFLPSVGALGCLTNVFWRVHQGRINNSLLPVIRGLLLRRPSSFSWVRSLFFTGLKIGFES